MPIEDHGRMRIAIPIELTEHELATLQQWARGRKTEARLVLRAKIILAAAEGAENQDNQGNLAARVVPSGHGEIDLLTAASKS